MREHCTIKIGTIRGRHEMPVDYYIFERIEPEDVFHFVSQQGIAMAEVLKIFDRELEGLDVNTPIQIDLYVTGLTSATICVLNAIRAISGRESFQREVHVYALHYDRESGKYCGQVVIL
mgnify:CR=1 FL=1